MSVDMRNQSKVGHLQLYELPDACIVSALALTSPKDASRLELVASWCRPLASSDDVWSSFLPADYRDILSRSPEGLRLLETPMSKKELYLRLCDHPLLIDDGTKMFNLDKASGKKQFMLSAKALTIVWADTEEYWYFSTRPESRFSSVAELFMVCWLEIQGAINAKMLSPNTKYAAYLVFALKPTSYGFELAPAEVSVGLSGDKCETQFVNLDPVGTAEVARERLRETRWWGMVIHHEQAGGETSVQVPAPEGQDPKRRRDGWMEVKMGEIYVKGDEDGDIEMRLAEIKEGSWKSGLCIEGIEIRPEVE